MICMDMIYVLSGNNAIKSRLRRDCVAHLYVWFVIQLLFHAKTQ